MCQFIITFYVISFHQYAGNIQFVNSKTTLLQQDSTETYTLRTQIRDLKPNKSGLLYSKQGTIFIYCCRECNISGTCQTL